MTDQADLEAMDYNELRALAKERGVQASGPKTEIIDALLAEEGSGDDNGDEPVMSTSATSEESFVEALDKDPGLVEKLKMLLGIGDATKADYHVEPVPLSATASEYPLNEAAMADKDLAWAIGEFDEVDKKREIMSWSIRGGLEYGDGITTDDRMFVTVVTRDGRKYAKEITDDDL